MEFGKETLDAIHSPRSGSRRRAKAEKTSEATWPLPWMLSQDMIVKGATPPARRRASLGDQAEGRGWNRARREICLHGRVSASNLPVTGWKLYPPSVTVMDTILVA